MISSFYISTQWSTYVKFLTFPTERKRRAKGLQTTELLAKSVERNICIATWHSSRRRNRWLSEIFFLPYFIWLCFAAAVFLKLPHVLSFKLEAFNIQPSLVSNLNYSSISVIYVFLLCWCCCAAFKSSSSVCTLQRHSYNLQKWEHTSTWPTPVWRLLIILLLYINIKLSFDFLLDT